MGPTNVALVKLYQADQALREAQGRLDAATRNVRIQERRVHDLEEKLRLAHSQQKELQTRAGILDLDLKTRDAHIEKLRTQQQTTSNAKEYNAFLVEIGSQKADRGKSEDEAMKVLGEVENAVAETAQFTLSLDAERTKLAQLKEQIVGDVATLRAEIAALQTPRDQAASAVPKRALELFERLSDHHDGEAMAFLIKPDRRLEQYACAACMMDLVTDVYNKLHVRDEMIFCPSCRRILYIPADLPPEMAVKQKKAAKEEEIEGEDKPAKPRKKEAPRARGKLGTILTAAQGESVKSAKDAAQEAIEFAVSIDGKVVGHYKGKTAENLLNIIKFRLGEAQLKHEAQVLPVVSTEQPANPDGESSESAMPVATEATPGE